MSKKVVSVIKYVLSLALAIVLLFLVFQNVKFSEFSEKASLVDYRWVILSILLSVVGYYARAYRWNILMKPLGFPHLSAQRTILAILVGYLANLAFPRLGEVTRCGMMKRSDDVPVSVSLGTVITERIIDLLTLALLIVVSLGLEYDRLMEFMRGAFSGIDLEGFFMKLIVAGLVGGLSVVVLFYILYQKNERIRSFMKELIRGVFSLREIDNFWGFLFSTVILWVTYYFMSYIIIFSMPETAYLSWSIGVMLLVVGGIALAMPVQGGIGTYHVFVGGMLMLYGVEDTTGVFLATLLHTSQLIATAVFGGLALIISFFIQKRRASESKQTEDSHPT